MASDALDAVTVQVPTVDAERTALLNEHPAEPAEVSEYVTAPVPDPPDVDNVRFVPTMTAVVEMVRDACVSLDTVMVTAPVVAEPYDASAAFVAVTVHVPADEEESTAPTSEQPAVPTDVTEYVTAPVPEPPDVDRVRVDPTFTVLSTMVRGDCASAGPPLVSHMAM